MNALQLARRIFLKDGRLRPILRTIVYAGAVAIASALLFVFVAPFLGPPPQTASGQLPPLKFVFAFESVLCVSVVSLAVLFRRYLDRRSVASLGLSLRVPWLRLFCIGALVGGGMQCLVFAIEAALGHSHVVGVAAPRDALADLSIYVPFYLIVAVLEETLLRGYVFQNFWEEFGLPAAVVLTSAAFAALHLTNPNSHQDLYLTIAGLAAYGALACLCVLWTRSLWVVFGVHFAWNLFEGPVLGFHVSGLDNGNTIVHQTVSGPAWFTGAAFGPEAGVSSLIVLAAGLAFVYWLHRRGSFAGIPDFDAPYAKYGGKRSLPIG